MFTLQLDSHDLKYNLYSCKHLLTLIDDYADGKSAHTISLDKSRPAKDVKRPTFRFRYINRNYVVPKNRMKQLRAAVVAAIDGGESSYLLGVRVVECFSSMDGVRTVTL